MLKIERGKCACCKEKQSPLFVLDIKDIEERHPFFQGNWEAMLKESDADNATCLKCWRLLATYIQEKVRIKWYAA